MNILFAINSLTTGGAEIFAIRLGYYFKKQGHNVFYFELYENIDKIDLFTKIVGEPFAPQYIQRYKPSVLVDKILWKIDVEIAKIGLKNTRSKLIKILEKRYLKKELKKHKIDVINSHLWESDFFISSISNLPQIITMHGNYGEKLYVDKKTDVSFAIKARNILQKAFAVIVISNENLKQIQDISAPKAFVKKIYNGFFAPPVLANSKIGNDFLENYDFVFGMLARGIEDKGWGIAIDSFIELKKRVNSQNSALVLVYTESSYMDDLKIKYKEHKDVYFMGKTDTPLAWIRCFNLFLFPSYYENLPNVIVEALCCEVPIIASNVGDIKDMICKDGIKAGEIVGFDPQTNKPSVSELTEKMIQLMDENRLIDYKNNAKILYQQFDMENCYQSYFSIFKQAVKKN